MLRRVSSSSSGALWCEARNRTACDFSAAPASRAARTRVATYPRLVGLVGDSDQRRRAAVRAIGPQVLGVAFGRERDDGVGGGQDRLRRAVIAIERHHARRRIERVREVEDVAHGRGAEGIDRLRVVADHGEAPAIGAERQHDLGLQRVGVLVFVDQQMIEAGGDLGSDVGLGQHLGEIEQEVVVIEDVLSLLRLDVSAEQGAERVFVRRSPGEPLAERRAERAAGVDHARIDGEARPLGRKALARLGESRLVPRPVHEVGRVLAVVDGELRIEAETRRIFAQEPRADGVKGARIGGRGGGGGLGRQMAGEKPLDAPAELGSRRGAKRSPA